MRKFSCFGDCFLDLAVLAWDDTIMLLSLCLQRMNRILIVEDEPRLASFINKGLKKNGFATTIASDGEQALQTVYEQEFDLILLDLGLPIKDGWEVLREVRHQGENLPIIIITALKDERSQTQVITSGANDYLPKPFSFSDLLTKVRSLLLTHQQNNCSDI